MKAHYDLIVAGGGFAGVGAAVAAARQGISVLLIEKNGFLSGSAAMSYVNPFMSQFRISNVEGGKRTITVNAGIFEEIRQELKSLGGMHENDRSLIPKALKNVLVAGRCISTTHEAQSAYRIMPICCCIGEGAGLALSLAVKNKLDDVRNVDIEKFHSIMDACNVLY